MSESDPLHETTSYTIEMAARITHIPVEEIVIYYRSGFVTPAEPGEESNLILDERAIHQLRRIAFLLSEYNLRGEGLKMVATLLNEVEQLRQEVRFLREQ